MMMARLQEATRGLRVIAITMSLAYVVPGSAHAEAVNIWGSDDIIKIWPAAPTETAATQLKREEYAPPETAATSGEAVDLWGVPIQQPPALWLQTKPEVPKKVAQPVVAPAITAPKSEENEDEDAPMAVAMATDGSGEEAVERCRYEVRPGETMRMALERWGACSSWTIEWDASRDWSLKYGNDYTDTGAMIKAASALANTLRYNGTPGTPTIDAYRNRIIRVSDPQ